MFSHYLKLKSMCIGDSFECLFCLAFFDHEPELLEIGVIVGEYDFSRFQLGFTTGPGS